jgi:hypothetical protein
MTKKLALFLDDRIPYIERGELVYVHQINEDDTAIVSSINPKRTRHRKQVPQTYISNLEWCILFGDTKQFKNYDTVLATPHLKHYKIFKQIDNEYVSELVRSDRLLIKNCLIKIFNSKSNFHMKWVKVINITNKDIFVVSEETGERAKIKAVNIIYRKTL